MWVIDLLFILFFMRYSFKKQNLKDFKSMLLNILKYSVLCMEGGGGGAMIYFFFQNRNHSKLVLSIQVWKGNSQSFVNFITLLWILKFMGVLCENIFDTMRRKRSSIQGVFFNMDKLKLSQTRGFEHIFSITILVEMPIYIFLISYYVKIRLLLALSH